MMLPCGHSFGGGGVQQVIRMKACFTCSQSISEDLIAPNRSLRSAVQAFRREEELHFYRSSKRKRERFDQDKVSQDRSLAKVSDDSSSKALPSKIHDSIHDFMSYMTKKECLFVNVGAVGSSFLLRVNEKGSMGLRFFLKESIFKQRLFQVKKD